MKQIINVVLAILLAIAIVIIVLEYFRYSTSRPIVRIGNEAISKKEYQDVVDFQAGGAILRKMVYSKLVLQAAEKEHIMPTKAEVDQRVADIRRRNPTVLATADQSASAMDSFVKDLSTDMALENLRIKGVTASPAELVSYYNANKRAFAVPPQVQTTMVVTQNSVSAGTAASLLEENTKEDIIARQPGLHVAGVDGYTVNMDVLPLADRQRVSSVIFASKVGDVKTIPVTGAYLTFKIKKSAGGGVPPIAQIKPLVERAVRLQKAPSVDYELAKLFQAADPQFEVERYSDFFNDVRSYDLKKNAPAGATR